MKNIEISYIFNNIAKLRQIKGEPPFRFRSYEKAADIIEGLTVDVGELIDAGEFQSLRGIGETIEEKTREILETGTCEAYEKLIAEMGIEVLDLLELRGIGEKTASRLYKDLDIRNLAQLSDAMEDGRLENMKGLGKKTLESITESMEFLIKYRGTRLFSMTQNLAKTFSGIFNGCDIVKRHEFTGDLRRREEVCRSLEITIECGNDIEATQNSLVELLLNNQHQISLQITEGIQDLPSKSPLIKSLQQIHLQVDNNFLVVVYLCSAENYESVLFITTATEEHLSALPSHNSVNISDTSEEQDYWQATENKTETEIYENLGMSFVPPELRQDAASINLAKNNQLPELIEYDDIRGDLHTHTDWSDGAHSMDDMIAGAINRGLEYYAITDHSVSSSVANGLDQGRLLEQIKVVRELDAKNEEIVLLTGSEVDIRRDGTLDYPDEILAQLDIVVASIHSQFSLSEVEMTKRMISAIENPNVMIIGHPTGRLLCRRPMYPINIDEIIAAAVEHDTILEINGSPSRLDLGPEYVRKAKEAGVLISINTDAHALPEPERYQYGVNVARRSGLTKEDVINTLPIDKLRETLR